MISPVVVGRAPDRRSRAAHLHGITPEGAPLVSGGAGRTLDKSWPMQGRFEYHNECKKRIPKEYLAWEVTGRLDASWEASPVAAWDIDTAPYRFAQATPAELLVPSGMLLEN